MLRSLPFRTRPGRVPRWLAISLGIALFGIAGAARAETVPGPSGYPEFPEAPSVDLGTFEPSEPAASPVDPRIAAEYEIAAPVTETRINPTPPRDSFDGARFGEQISFGLSLREFDYREELAAPFKSTEHGVMPAMRIAYFRENGLGPFFVEGAAGFGGASLQYDGSTQKGQAASGVTPSTLADVSARAGVRLWSAPGRVASRGRLYAGAAFHYWSRGDGGFMPGTEVVSVREIYRRLYAPIGLRVENDLGPRVSLAADASLRPAVMGRMTMEFSRSYAGGQDTTVSLGDRLGWRAELPLSWRATPDLVLTFSPWYERSAIGVSDRVTTQVSARRRETVWEPSSATSELGTAFDVSVRL